MAMKSWMGIDVGTSAVKVIVVRDDGLCIARGSASYAAMADGPRHEQDPADYLRAVRAAVLQCDATPDGIGVVGQTPSLVIVDEHGAPTRPVITWRDIRAVEEAAELAH